MVLDSEVVTARPLAIWLALGWALGVLSTIGYFAVTGGLYEYRVAHFNEELDGFMRSGCWEIVDVRTAASPVWQVRKSRLHWC